jgi:SAM-dependent methyltransferase
VPDYTESGIYPQNALDEKSAFSRLDEGEDAQFYARDRFVPHLDALALETVERLIQILIVEKNPVILDLMAGVDSHIPQGLEPGKIVGLGLNRNELSKNQALSEYVIHDLNLNPRLPFPENSFDAVINTVSIDYMTRPVEVFMEVNRILKPGGLLLIIFSNRMFPEKAVKIWREAGEDERILLVEDFFRIAGGFEKTNLFVSKGRPRPKSDKYAYLGTPSDPVYAVYADRAGGDPRRKLRPSPNSVHEELLDEAVVEINKGRIKETLQCPYCGGKMKKWAVPDNPFEATWSNDFLYICFNDQCPYYVRGWDHMYKTTHRLASYRLMYNPDRDVCSPIPVPSPKALRESIIE